MARNLRKVPRTLLDRIRSFDQDDIVVACAKFLKPEDISKYDRLGLKLVDGRLVIPPPILPDANTGKYSKANVEGLEVTRKDLPKVPKIYEFESPNWGDWSNGSHTVSWTRDVYQRDFYPPKEVELSIELLEEKNGGFVVKFSIDQVLNRRTGNFEQELFYNLNLLQENVGASNVFTSAATLADYNAAIRVDWQILPPGRVDDVIREMLAGRRSRPTDEQISIMTERLKVLSQLSPEAYIAGSDGFLRYFGAKFGDDLVVFENTRYGNAIYVMGESWQELSRRTRIDLLAGPRDSFTRIPHRGRWESDLKDVVERYRARQMKGK